MSWLFGIKQPPNIPGSPVVPTERGSNDPGDVDENDILGQSSAYHFDSTALERASKTAEYLASSRNAREILDSDRMKEVNNQMQFQGRIKELDQNKLLMKQEQQRISQEERRKTLAEEMRNNQTISQYKDQLSRKRYEDQMILQQRINQENIKIQEESHMKQEAIRKATVEHEMALRQKNEMQRIESQLRATAMRSRENRDVRIEQIRAKAAEYRTTVLDSIKTSGALIGAGMKEFVSDWNRVTASALAVGALTLGFYTSKTGIGVAFRFLEARLGKPSLTRETSRLTFIQFLKHPIKIIRRIYTQPQDTLKGNIHKPEMEERLLEIALATRNTKRNKGVYKNLLIFGPPGTGKTLFAKSLAYHSAMDYALMTGGNAVTLGSEAPVAMNKLFDWASTSRRGLLLFIDEAGALFRPRTLGGVGASLQATFETFLLRTSEQSNKFMLVLSTNYPNHIDSAVLSRIDTMLEFNLPGLQERERLIRYYFEKHILIPAIEGKRKFKVAQFDYLQKCTEIAQKTDGLSGRDIDKLALAWQDQAFLSTDGMLTEAMMDLRVSEFILKSRIQANWDQDLLQNYKNNYPLNVNIISNVQPSL